jgi:regulator of cell morphogenesis and NO signaling
MLHFAQEEVEVFPLMQREATKKAYEKVVSLESDHEAAGDLIKRLINATHDFTAPVDGCATYRATYALLKQLVEDIFLHIYKENSILFPMYAEGVNA